MAGSPVLDEKLFFGRERLIDRILQTLHNNSLLLHGERRIGKTTLQHQLKRRLQALDDPAYQFYPVYIDLQGTPEERFFATLAEEIFQELAPVLDGLEPRTPPAGDYTYRDLLGDLRAILKTLRAGTGKRVRLVLLIDEVDELNSYDPRVNQKLRSLFMKSFAENLVAVVSGVSIKREWDREGSPWYNFFEEIDVGPLRLEAARELIERPIRGVLKFDDGAVERIVELSDYRPYRIQRLCMKLVSRMYELRSPPGLGGRRRGDRRPSEPGDGGMTPVPFVIGQWVRGERFYGRERLIDEILDGPRNGLWLLGTRRIGKTSLLKQLEHLAAASPERGYFPLFWDLQGADDPRELHAGFADALLDAEDRLEAIGIEVAEVEADDLFAAMGRLRRKLRAEAAQAAAALRRGGGADQAEREGPGAARQAAPRHAGVGGRALGPGVDHPALGADRAARRHLAVSARLRAAGLHPHACRTTAPGP